MKSFVIMSFYQLSHAIAMTLEMNEKPDLYFAVTHVGAGEELLARIRHTGVFNNVIEMDQRVFNKAFMEELKGTQNFSSDQIDEIGCRIFDKYLEPYYAEIFSKADFEDSIYVYNDFQPHYYYIAKHFPHIIGVEDGYGVMEKQLQVVKEKDYDKFAFGKYKAPFIGKYWPDIKWKHENVETVISSVPFKCVPDYLTNKLKIIDYYDLVKRNYDKHKQIMKAIFPMLHLDIEDNSILFLTQPLDRNRLCSSLENYLLNRKTISKEIESGKVVYVKPHPAERIDFSIFEQANVRILPKDFPVEMIAYVNGTFDAVVSYNSTAAELISNAKEKKYILGRNVDSRAEMIQTIKRYVKDEFVTVDIYLKVEELTPEIYINVYSYIAEVSPFKININVILKGEMFVQGCEYFDLANMEKMISEYYNNQSFHQKPDFWQAKVGNFLELNQHWPQNVEMKFVSADDTLSNAAVQNYLKKKSVADYFIFIDAHNNGFLLVKDIIDIIKNSVVKKINIFPSYTIINGERKFLGGGVVGECLSPHLSNRLIHKSVFEKYKKNQIFDIVRSDIAVRVRTELYVEKSDYSSISNGFNHYSNEIMTFSSTINESEDMNGKLDYLGLIIMEYYNWLLINENDDPMTAIYELLTNSKLEEKILLKGFFSFVTELLRDRDAQRKRIIYKKQDLYRSVNGLIDKLMENGEFGRVTDTKTISSDSDKKKKTKKGNWLRIFKRLRR